jgi:hypothetical protein
MGSWKVALLGKSSCHSTEPRPTQEQQQEEPGEEVGDARQGGLMLLGTTRGAARPEPSQSMGCTGLAVQTWSRPEKSCQQQYECH